MCARSRGCCRTSFRPFARRSRTRCFGPSFNGRSRNRNVAAFRWTARCLARLRNQWQDMRLDLVTELDRPFGCYEIVDGRAHWRKDKFADYVRRHRMSWPTYETGTLDRDRPDLSRDGRQVSAHRAVARAALFAVEAAAQRSRGRKRPSQPRAVVGLSAPRPAAMRRARRSTCSARPSGCGS